MRRILIFILAGACFLLLAGLFALPAYGVKSSAKSLQTWPSRTPTPSNGSPPTGDTPDPPDPTNTSEPGGGDETPTSIAPSSTPTPISPPPGNGTAIPSLIPSATSVLPTEVVPGQPTSSNQATLTIPEITPLGGFLPTAEPCVTSPTVQALGTVNVRSGPGLDYENIGQLVYFEVRPLIGRTGFAQWWLIQLPDGRVGWVANQAVNVNGYIGAVPVLDPPLINGEVPTPGPAWNPTPNLNCTPTASTGISVTISTSSADQPTPDSSNNEEGQQFESANSNNGSDSSAGQTEQSTSRSPTPENSSSTQDNEGLPSQNQEEPEGSNASWILFAGAGFLVLGLIAVFVQRRSG